MDDIRNLVFFGGRGGAQVTADYIVQPNSQWRLLGYLNDEVEKGSNIGSYDVLGRFRDWRAMPKDTFFNAPLHKAKEMHHRAQIISGLGIPKERWASVVHLHALVSESSALGAGASLGPYCNVLPSTRIGDHVGLRGNCYVGHDCVLEDYVFVGAQSAVAAYCHLGEGAHIGPGSVVRDGTQIGRFSVVGVGSAVIRDVQDYEIVAGNPARTIGFLEQKR